VIFFRIQVVMSPTYVSSWLVNELNWLQFCINHLSCLVFATNTWVRHEYEAPCLVLSHNCCVILLFQCEELGNMPKAYKSYTSTILNSLLQYFVTSLWECVIQLIICKLVLINYNHVIQISIGVILIPSCNKCVIMNVNCIIVVLGLHNQLSKYF